MRTAQERFFATLDELAESHGHEVTVEYSYANTGRATLTPEGSFQPSVSFNFQFSNGHNVFKSAGLFVGRGRTGARENTFLAKDFWELGEVLDFIESALLDHTVAPPL